MPSFTNEILSDEAKVLRFKNQRNNMEIKLKEKTEELNKLNDKFNKLEVRHQNLEKDYTKSCHERNKCELLLEKRMNVRMEEYTKFKDFYLNYSPYIDKFNSLKNN